MFAGRRLGFNHDLPGGDMNRDVEGRAAVQEHAVEEAFDSIAASQHGDPVAQVVNRLRREQVLD
ncbi:hypothetical protein D3C72_1493940 [compost metagenome]